QDDDGPRAAFPCEEQITLDAPVAEIAVQSRHDEEHVDVGGDYLLTRDGSALFAGEGGLTRQHRGHAYAGFQLRPVAHRRARIGRATEVPRYGTVAPAPFEPYQKAHADGEGYERGLDAVARIARELIFEIRIPSKFCEGHFLSVFDTDRADIGRRPRPDSSTRI